MKRLISGPSLCGFHGIFEDDFGAAETESDMPTITPSAVGNSMLPFRCPTCREIPQALACPKTREHYRDRREGRERVYWCPLCRSRFRLDNNSVPLPCALEAGAVVGPSRVERGGMVSWQDRPGTVSTVLGAILWPLRTLHPRNVEYQLLQRQIPR